MTRSKPPRLVVKLLEHCCCGVSARSFQTISLLRSDLTAEAGRAGDSEGKKSCVIQQIWCHCAFVRNSGEALFRSTTVEFMLLIMETDQTQLLGRLFVFATQLLRCLLLINPSTHTSTHQRIHPCSTAC